MHEFDTLRTCSLYSASAMLQFQRGDFEELGFGGAPQCFLSRSPRGLFRGHDEGNLIGRNNKRIGMKQTPGCAGTAGELPDRRRSPAPISAAHSHIAPSRHRAIAPSRHRAIAPSRHRAIAPLLARLFDTSTLLEATGIATARLVPLDVPTRSGVACAARHGQHERRVRLPPADDNRERGALAPAAAPGAGASSLGPRRSRRADRQCMKKKENGRHKKPLNPSTALAMRR